MYRIEPINGRFQLHELVGDHYEVMVFRNKRINLFRNVDDTIRYLKKTVAPKGEKLEVTIKIN